MISERTIVVQARVAAPADEVWRLWATSEGMAEWWMADNRIELRRGGPYELYFMKDSPPGLQGSEGCQILSYLPGRMVSFTWNAPPHLKTRDRHTWVVVETLAQGAGTLVRLTHAGWPAADWDTEGSDWPETFAYFESAWQRVMDLLQAHTAGGLNGDHA